VTDRARKVLEDAKALSVEERADLAAELLATLPPHAAEELHPEWAAELTRRARCAWADPEGGEPWEEETFPERNDSRSAVYAPRDPALCSRSIASRAA
jgi:putative addiction module component (TIGR02574 family)